jgi:hypothetical protein
MQKEPTRKLRELATVCPGYSPTPAERKASGEYLVIGGRNIKNGQLVRTKHDSYLDQLNKASFRRAIARPGDIIVSTLFDTRKLYIYQRNDPKAVINGSCAIIRVPENSDYIVSYLRTAKGCGEFLENATKVTAGACIPRLRISDLEEILIPILLPVDELSKLGDSYIHASSNDELDILYDRLRSKEDEIQALKSEVSEVRRYYEDRLQAIQCQRDTNALKGRIAHGETRTLEFKPSIGWNHRQKKIDRNIETGVLKTIVAFCNTDGGELLIGVGNHGEIIGLDGDPRCANDDRVLLQLVALIQARIMPSVAHYVRCEIVPLDGKKICKVVCSKSIEDVWLKEDKSFPEAFYVREGPSSTALSPRNAFRFIRARFRDGCK